MAIEHTDLSGEIQTECWVNLWHSLLLCNPAAMFGRELQASIFVS